MGVSTPTGERGRKYLRGAKELMLLPWTTRDQELGLVCTQPEWKVKTLAGPGFTCAPLRDLFRGARTSAISAEVPTDKGSDLRTVEETERRNFLFRTEPSAEWESEEAIDDCGEQKTGSSFGPLPQRSVERREQPVAEEEITWSEGEAKAGAETWGGAGWPSRGPAMAGTGAANAGNSNAEGARARARAR